MPARQSSSNGFVDPELSIRLENCDLLSDEAERAIAERMDLLGKNIINVLFSFGIFHSWLITTLKRIVTHPKSGWRKFRGDAPNISMMEIESRIAALSDTENRPRRASAVELALKFRYYENFVRHLLTKEGSWKTTPRWDRLIKYWTEWGDVRERLINAHLRLAIDIAKGYKDKGLGYPDICQEAFLGLTRCMGNFEFRRGYQVSTFVTPWIHQAIQGAIKKKKRTVRLPDYADRLIGEYRLAENRMMDEQDGRRPTVDEVCKRCGWKTKTLIAILAASTQSSLDELLGVKDDRAIGATPTRLANITPVEKTDLIKAIMELYEKLNPRERLIIEERFGLRSGESKTLRKLGQQVGLTRERVRQIQDIALQKIRNSIDP